jgi:hypothetical protein
MSGVRRFLLLARKGSNSFGNVVARDGIVQHCTPFGIAAAGIAKPANGPKYLSRKLLRT